MIVDGTNIEMIRGDTEFLTVSLVDTKGNKIDLVEGDTIHFTIKEYVSNNIIKLQKVVTEFIEGEAFIEIKSIDTKDWLFKNYIYDVQLTRGIDYVKTIVPVSNFKICEEVTYD